MTDLAKPVKAADWVVKETVCHTFPKGVGLWNRVASVLERGVDNWAVRVSAVA